MDISLVREADFESLAGEIFKVLEFLPLISVEKGVLMAIDSDKTYGSVTMVCKSVKGEVKASISHKIDYLHLWEAFKVRTVGTDEEVLVGWEKQKRRVWPENIFGSILPRFHIMICRKDAFELLTDSHHEPELKGEARRSAERPIVEWRPEKE